MSSDQQYPYGPQDGWYEQQDGRYGPQDGRYGQQSYGDGAAYDPHAAPAAYDPYAAGAGRPAHQGQQPPADPDPDPDLGRAGQGAAQTWQGQTWDTQYQPTVRRAQNSPPQPQNSPPQPQPANPPGLWPGAGHPQGQGRGRPAPTAAGGDYPQAHPVQPSWPGAGYPQPQGAPGAYPLPPEVPVGTAAPATGPALGAPGGDGAGGAGAGGAGYGSSTTLGNSRVTDAQRARAEGRSPIIAPGMQPAAITAGLGLLLALGAAVGPYALLVPLVLLQAVTAAGWFRLNGMWPARQGIVLAFAGGLVADAVLLAAGRENAPAALLGTLGVWVLLTFVLQLRSHAGADERMYGLMASVASASLAVLAAGHLAAVPDAVTVGAVAVAAAVLARALPLPGAASVVVALLVAAGAGAAAGAAFTDFGAGSAFLGLAAGGCALIGLRVASYDYPSRFVHMTAGVALPLTAAAPAVYLIGRAIG